MIATAVDEHRRPDPAPVATQCAPGRPGLSCDEEIELAARVARGDHLARNRHGPGQPRPGPHHRQGVPRPWPGGRRPGRRGQPGVAPGGPGVRSAVRHPVQHLCELLDQAGDPPRADQHHRDGPAAGAHGGPADEVAAGRAGAGPRVTPGAELRGGRDLPGTERGPEDHGGPCPAGAPAPAGQRPDRRGERVVGRGIDRPARGARFGAGGGGRTARCC